MSANDEYAFINLVDMLTCRAVTHQGQLAFTYLVDGEQQELVITYDDLEQRARALGAWLQQNTQPGDRVLLLYPPGIEYIIAFFGCLYAGVVAVPAYPPRLNRPSPHIPVIVMDSQITTILTVGLILREVEKRFEAEPYLRFFKWLNTESVPTTANQYHHVDIPGETLAFIQYTSGSTSTPKGVMLSHANLLHNLMQIRRFFDPTQSNDQVHISWLPTYHDMGLIGCLLEPIFSGIPSVFMSPLAFLQQPIRWLEAISRYKGTISGGPNFAYELCVERVKPERLPGLDLSTWRLAFSGAEPVRMETIDRFSEKFRACGFKRQAFYPCYGLAEATLIVSGGIIDQNPRYISLDRSALEKNRIQECAPSDEGSMKLVNCGAVDPDQEIVIVDPQTNQRRADNEIGEIWVKGPSIAQGYWNRPDETQRIFKACLETGEGPFMRTGDLGFLRAGELFITGRSKDLIIVHGSNHYPQDIEYTVESAHPSLVIGGCAVFTIEENGEEQVVVAQEVNLQVSEAELPAIYHAIRTAVSAVHDLQLYSIVLLKPTTIPKTSSGKIRRHECKTAFQEGKFEMVGEWRASHA